jgi:hypothetical protein
VVVVVVVVVVVTGGGLRVVVGCWPPKPPFPNPNSIWPFWPTPTWVLDKIPPRIAPRGSLLFCWLLFCCPFRPPSKAPKLIRPSTGLLFDCLLLVVCCCCLAAFCKPPNKAPRSTEIKKYILMSIWLSSTYLLCSKQEVISEQGREKKNLEYEKQVQGGAKT